ncbi:MAG: serine/threonine-protein kinase [Gemmatimonadaceae bacterium]
MTAVDDPSRRALVASAFEQVVELEGTERDAMINSLDRSTRAEVESLLSALERKGQRLEPRLPLGARVLDGSAARVGAYRLLRLVGRGGMGAVYEAERADATFVKRVAVKLIREDVTGADVARRFARERAILAGLEHPNIARMLDGGTLADGREYLVMEFVDGESITSYCASRHLGIRQRLELFLHVCAAVQFSHQHFVVHGDIKPGNILVTVDGTPKLVDFGVAKVIEEGDSRTRDPLTALGALTPAYASPEQWRGESLSALSDIYSLGVVLYELLAGARPFAIDSRTTLDVLREIEAGARAPSVAASQGEDASGDDRRRRRMLSGELDTIVLTAIDALRRRRYQTVERLSDDVQRYLDGRLVLAQPATYRYRLTKFLRRHRKAVVAGTALALTVLVGGVVATVQARRANRERAVAERISNFLKQMLSAPDASWVHAGNADVRVADVLDAAAAQADSGLRSEPAAQAMVLRTIGAAYRALNRFDDADRELNKALKIDSARKAPGFPDLAEDFHELGWSMYQHGDWTTALKYYQEAHRHCAVPQADTSVVCYQAVADYALALTTRARFAESESVYTEVVRRGKIRFGENAAPLAVVYGNLGFIADNRGDLEGAERWYRLALGAWKSGPQPSERVVFYHSLAWNQLQRGNLAAAEQFAYDGVKSAHATDQDRAIATMMVYVDAAMARRRLLDADSARALLNQARRAIPPNTPGDHPTVSAQVLEDGIERLVANTPVVAESLFRAAERSRIKAYSEGDPRIARVQGWIGIAVGAQGRFNEAQTLISRAAAVLDSAYSPKHPLALEMRGALLQLDSARVAREKPSAAAARFGRYAAIRL